MLDAGMVGTEMLYYLVGSRDLDGGLMCTASHNPKAYTGAKLVRARARSRCPATPASARSRRCSPTGCGERAAAAASSEDVDVYAEFQDAALKFIDPGAVQPRQGRARRRQRHGRPDGRPDPRAPRRARARRAPTGSPTASSPTTSPTRCCRRTASSSSRKVRDEGADLGIAWDGDADRCFFIDETGEFVRRRLPHRAARRVAPAEAPGRGRSSTTSAPRGRSPTPSRRPAGAPW